MTLGDAAAAGVRLIVWCWDCRHQVEPDPAEHATRYGPQTTVLDWKARLVCTGVDQHSDLRENSGKGPSGNFRRPDEKIRFAMDSPVEGGVSCELVSENAKFPASRENTGNFIDSGLGGASEAAKKGMKSVSYGPIPYAS